jgi:hypothetical protein
MVNPNKEVFTKVAIKHSTFKEENRPNRGLNDESYNNQSNTDKSVGATGRK